MKKVPHTLFFALFAVFLSACSPKVITHVTKKYPVLPEDESVAVFERENDDKVPGNAETLGDVAVIDNGFSTGGSYEKVVQQAVDETRMHGGNGFLITDHLKPSFWGSSIHQIAGLMLRIDENDTSLVSSRETYTSIREESERRRINIPEHTLILNGGYARLTTRTKNLSGAAKRFEDRLSNGITWNAQYYYHHKGFPYGFGLMLSQYYSSPFRDVVYDYHLHHVRLDYAGISLGFRRAISPDWIWGFYFGIGYLGLTQKVTQAGNLSNHGSLTGSTLGSHFGFEFQYRISERVGIGAEVSDIGGFFSSVKHNNLVISDGAPSVSSENPINAGRFNATLGVRYYLKK